MIHRNYPRLILEYTWLPDAEDAEEAEGVATVGWSPPRQAYRELFDSDGEPWPPNEWTRTLSPPDGMDTEFRGNSYDNGAYIYGLVSWSGRMHGRVTGLLQIRGWLSTQDPAVDTAEYEGEFELSHASNETGPLPIRDIDLTAEAPAAAFSHWTCRFIPSHLRALAGE